MILLRREGNRDHVAPQGQREVLGSGRFRGRFECAVFLHPLPAVFYAVHFCCDPDAGHRICRVVRRPLHLLGEAGRRPHCPRSASPRVAGQAGGALGGVVLTLILYPAALGIFLNQLGIW